MLTIHSDEIARLEHMAKKFLVPGLLPQYVAHWICAVAFLPLALAVSLWAHSAHRLYIVMMSQIFKLLFLPPDKFYKYKTSMDQKFIIERIVSDQVCSSSVLTSFTDMSFIMVVYRENAFCCNAEQHSCLTHPPPKPISSCRLLLFVLLPSLLCKCIGHIIAWVIYEF